MEAARAMRPCSPGPTPVRPVSDRGPTRKVAGLGGAEVHLPSCSHHEHADRRRATAEDDGQGATTGADQAPGLGRCRNRACAEGHRGRRRLASARGRACHPPGQCHLVHGLRPRLLLDRPSHVRRSVASNTMEVWSRRFPVFFVGLKGLYSVSSAEVHGVGGDAARGRGKLIATAVTTRMCRPRHGTPMRAERAWWSAEGWRA